MTKSPDEQAVLLANSAFYKAFGAMDYDAMAAVWAQRASDICVHPGWPFLRGWKDIRAAWQAIFAGTGFMQVSLSEVTVEITGPVARVCCVENLYSVYEEQAVASQVAATNLFLYTDRGWRMTLHHGSPIGSTPVEAEPDIN